MAKKDKEKEDLGNWKKSFEKETKSPNAEEVFSSTRVRPRRRLRHRTVRTVSKRTQK